MTSWRLAFHLVEDAGDHVGSEFLGGQAVPRAVYVERLPRFGERGHYVLIERLTHGTRLFGAVEHNDSPGRCRDCRDEGRRREGPVEPDLHHAHLVAFIFESTNRLVRCPGPRAHDDHDGLGLRRARVLEEVVPPAGLFADLSSSSKPRPQGLRHRRRWRPPGLGRRRRDSEQSLSAPAGWD